MTGVLLIALMTACAAMLSAQEPPEEEQLLHIEGVVVDSASKEPIARARVSARHRDGAGSFETPTDIRGRFLLRGLRPGEYSFGIGKQGYWPYTRGHVPGARSQTSLTLRPGKPIEDLRIELQKLGVITGRVTNENGEPLVQSQIEAHCVEILDNASHCTGGGSTDSDDRGLFRIYDLRPGRYIVFAQPPSGSSGSVHRQPALDDPDGEQLDTGYLTTFYPNVIDPKLASLVDVHSGAESGGIEIRLERHRTFSVSG